MGILGGYWLLVIANLKFGRRFRSVDNQVPKQCQDANNPEELNILQAADSDKLTIVFTSIRFKSMI